MAEGLKIERYKRNLESTRENTAESGQFAMQVVTSVSPIEILVYQRTYLYDIGRHLPEREKQRPQKVLWMHGKEPRTKTRIQHNSLRDTAPPKNISQEVDDSCIYCGAEDSTEHMAKECNKWFAARNKLE
ncbi:hypothetical protein JTB14_033836 [Gonioctena quinquepunctata]|nr:hypothetical protein JTB14_033836 [Gonioctena quinquepunctata]